MRLGIQAAALGAMEQQKRLDVIANNLANANTAGFKKDEVRFDQFLVEHTYTRLTQGPINTTENPMDLAISGEGYLRVKAEDGEFYTRAGNLTLNRDKVLVTQEGWPVLGKNGPIRLEEGTTIRIEKDGQVFDGDVSVDTLDLVNFPPDAQLSKERNGYLKPASDQVQPVPATNFSIEQGSLEGANFSTVEEMARLVDTMRAFESYQKMIQTSYRDLDSQLITKLGT